jgi:hypothetical protein
VEFLLIYLDKAEDKGSISSIGRMAMEIYLSKNWQKDGERTKASPSISPSFFLDEEKYFLNVHKVLQRQIRPFLRLRINSIHSNSEFRLFIKTIQFIRVWSKIVTFARLDSQLLFMLKIKYQFRFKFIPRKSLK